MVKGCKVVLSFREAPRDLLLPAATITANQLLIKTADNQSETSVGSLLVVVCGLRRLIQKF